MREIPEIGQEATTLFAVGVGAVLATVGGFVATLFEARMRRRERERTAAVTFGEILASLRVMIRASESSHSIGDPWGQLTLRLFRSARREVDCYERHRTALSDLRDTDLRLALHAAMIRVMLGLDGILEATSDEIRQGSYTYLLDVTPSLDDLVHRLIPLAGQPISPYDTLSHHPTGRVPSAALDAAQAAEATAATK
jgi:hypothetical protein